MTLPRIDDELEPKKAGRPALDPPERRRRRHDRREQPQAGRGVAGRPEDAAGVAAHRGAGVPGPRAGDAGGGAPRHKQYLVVQALRDAGYRVEEQDLVADKRKRRKV
jgi:hypothetical protein